MTNLPPPPPFLETTPHTQRAPPSFRVRNHDSAQVKALQPPATEGFGPGALQRSVARGGGGLEGSRREAPDVASRSELDFVFVFYLTVGGQTPTSGKQYKVRWFLGLANPLGK